MLGSTVFTRGLAVALVSLSLAACTTTGGYFAPKASMDAAKLDAGAADGVAADMVARLAEHVGPGTGTIAFKGDNSAFATAFDKHLRSWGYAVDPAASGAGAIALAYTVDTADGQVLARVSTPTVELARTYTATTTGATPASPLSVMTRGQS